MKMHENCKQIGKGRVFRSYPHLRKKTLEDWRRKITKILWLDRSREKGMKRKENFLNFWRTRDVKPFYFSFFSKLDRSSTNRVPIEPDREFPLKQLKLSISRKIASIDRNLNKTYSIDRKPIEPTQEQWLKIKEFLIGWKNTFNQLNLHQTQVILLVTLRLHSKVLYFEGPLCSNWITTKTWFQI